MNDNRMAVLCGDNDLRLLRAALLHLECSLKGDESLDPRVWQLMLGLDHRPQAAAMDAEAMLEGLEEDDVLPQLTDRLVKAEPLDDIVARAVAHCERLPAVAYGELPTNGDVIRIRRGQRGYFPADAVRGRADQINAELGVTPAQAEAMMFGSLFGFDAPGADPERYSADGRMLPKAGAKVSS